MQAQSTEHFNTKMHTKLKAAEAKEAQAGAELADLRAHLRAQARENETLQAENCDLKQALAVRAPELQLTAAETLCSCLENPSALLSYSRIRAVRTSCSEQDMYVQAGTCSLQAGALGFCFAGCKALLPRKAASGCLALRRIQGIIITDKLMLSTTFLHGALPHPSTTVDCTLAVNTCSQT